MSGGIGSVTDARLAMLAFVVTNWLIVWFLRFLPTPIKNPLIRASIQISFAATLLGVVIGQIVLYEFPGGIRVLKNDQFFVVAFLGEYVIGLCILFCQRIRASTERKKSRTDELTYTGGEYDGSGLLFDRSRYYSTSLQRSLVKMRLAIPTLALYLQKRLRPQAIDWL